MHDVMSAHMLNGNASASSCTYKLSAMRSEFWLLFVPGRGAYDVPLGDVKEELRFHCELEPFNMRDANNICLKCPGTSRGRLQLNYRPCFYLDFMLKGEFCCYCACVLVFD